MALWSASGAVTKSRPVDMLAVRLSGQLDGGEIPTFLDFTILIAHRMGLRLCVTSREPQCCLEDLSEGAG